MRTLIGAVAATLLLSTAAFAGHSQCELHGFKKNRAHLHRGADAAGQLHQLALRVESGAAFLDVSKPLERTLDRRAGAGAHYANGDERPHQHLGADGAGVAHLAR